MPQNKITQYLEETDKLFEEKIFKIISRIIGTALQEGTITGKYADDFEEYRKEILELCHQRQLGLIELVRSLVPEKLVTRNAKEDGSELLNIHIGGFNSCREQFLKNLEK